MRKEVIFLLVLMVVFVVSCSQDISEENIAGEAGKVSMGIPRTYNSCNDTDGGNNPKVIGTMTVQYTQLGKKIKEAQKDACVSSKQREYYCIGKIPQYVDISCSYGCLNGVCKQKTPNCQAGPTGNYRCTGNVREQEIQDIKCGKKWQNVTNCQYGCSNNACVPVCNATPIIILETYASLQAVKSTLTNITVLGSNCRKTGYGLVSELLQDYNGNSNNDEKEVLFNRLDGYPFNPDQKEYIIRVVHSIWLEQQHITSWSLNDYSSEEINDLFWVLARNDFVRKPATSLSPNNYVGEWSTHLSEEASFKLFLMAQKLKKVNQQDTIDEIIKWQKKNFFHAYYDYTWERYNDGQELDPSAGGLYFPVSLNRLFEERVTGCHEISVLFTNFLRSMNIPAVSINIQGHALTYLPTMDRYVHGDHIADFVTVPAEDFFLTKEQVSEIINLGGEDYDSIIRNKYHSQIYFPNIELHRNGAYLFLETDSVCGNIPVEDWQRMQQEVSEYNLQYNQSACRISSDLVPIQTLQELSN